MGGPPNHPSLTVSSLAASETAFHEPIMSHLGFEKVEGIEGIMTVWHHAADASAVNLWHAHGDGAARDRYRPGPRHVALDATTRDEVDALHEVLSRERIVVLDAPEEYPQHASGHYAVFFADPDGLKFELVHMPATPD